MKPLPTNTNKHFLKNYCNSAIILCGGKGSRLGVVGKHTPKSLLKVNHKTLLEHHIATLENYGISEVYFITGFLSNKIEAFIETLNMKATTHIVKADELGTGGSIKRGADFVNRNKRFYFVVMADILCQPNLNVMLKKSLATNAKINILGAQVHNSEEYGIIIHDNHGRISEFKEKVKIDGWSTVDAGYYLFDKDVFKDKEYPEKFSIEYDLFPYIKDMFVTEHNGPWIDVGTISRLKQARKIFDKDHD